MNPHMMNQGGAVSGQVQPVAPTEIPTQINQLQGSVERLAIVLSKLHERIEPILSTNNPATPHGGQPIPPVSTRMGTILQDLNSRLSAMANDVAIITERVQL